MSEAKKAREIQVIEEKEAEYGTIVKCFSETNKVWLRGTVAGYLWFSHRNYGGRKFYKTKIAIRRKSGVIDYVPIIISKEMLDEINGLQAGQYVEVGGRLYSYNNKSHLELSVFARVIIVLESDDGMEDENSIFIVGNVRKPPYYRISPVSYKKITDLFLSVEREGGKYDYIPCLAWDRNAENASFLNIGDTIKAYGRIQSREYKKRLDFGESKVVEVYEVSISEFI